MINASANLISAVINSVSNSVYGWNVSSFTVNISILGGAEVELNEVVLKASNLSSSSNSAAPVQFIYKYVETGYSNSYLTIDGVEYRTANNLLRTTINSLANTFLTNKSEEWSTILIGNSVPSTNNIPTDVLASINNSFSNNIGKWTVLSRHESIIADTTSLSIVLLSNKYKFNNQAVAMSYHAHLNANGSLNDASISISGIEWRTLDVSLYNNLNVLASNFTTNSISNIIRVFV